MPICPHYLIMQNDLSKMFVSIVNELIVIKVTIYIY